MPAASPAQLGELEAVLDAGPAAWGWQDQCRTLARIAGVARRRFGVEYTLAGLDLLLHRISWILCRRRHKAHLIRNTFRLASKRDWDALRRHVKPIYTAVNAAAARAALDDLAEAWGQRYAAIVRLWEDAWEEFIPFLDYDVEIRRVICSTNASVIWSPRGAVLHVDHGGVGGRVLPGGRGYLPLSITRIFRRNHACSAGAVARLVA